ncbi:unnamed protein product [Prorocentrum cordatum]|uniref:Uncharacterized protein n=1 Tax=Prorocentrum cordatum TaxID=2364126 RepID=A0ABN9PL07_9DINO|nr:unnamed protein product [Polarella glacialis]
MVASQLHAHSLPCRPRPNVPLENATSAGLGPTRGGTLLQTSAKEPCGTGVGEEGGWNQTEQLSPELPQSGGPTNDASRLRSAARHAASGPAALFAWTSTSAAARGGSDVAQRGHGRTASACQRGAAAQHWRQATQPGPCDATCGAQAPPPKRAQAASAQSLRHTPPLCSPALELLAFCRPARSGDKPRTR